MSADFAQARDLLGDHLREYLSCEQNRRDARSALYSFGAFFIMLYMASHGVMPSYLMIERPGRAMAIHFVPTAEPLAADIARTRLRDAPRSAGAREQKPPAKSERPPKLQSLSSMAASRPDYYGRQPLLPPVRADRPVVSDMPAQWRENPARERIKSDRPTFGSAAVDMPAPKIGTAGGTDNSPSEISFDVPVAGGSRGDDFITLSSRTVPSSVGRPGGKEMSVRRPILRSTLPTIPEWFERKGLDSFLTLRIVISADGKVEKAEVEKTSGFKELDAEARVAILQWIFEPTGYRESIVVKLNYRLR